jgi:multidrug resistance protein MdtO
MATAAQSLPQTASFLDSFFEYLRDELKFYPGRAAKMGRITLAVVLTFIVLTTFRVPGEVYGVIAVFLVSRDNPGESIRSTIASTLGTAAGVALVLAGALVFADSEFYHFFFLIGGFLVLFFFGRILVNPLVAPNMVVGFYASNLVWESAATPEAQVESCLWLFLCITIGLAIGCAVELLFVRQGPLVQLRKDIDERIHAAENVFLSFSEKGRDAERMRATEKMAQLALVGTGRLRRQTQLITRNHSRSLTYYAELSTVIALTSRLVDVTANLNVISTQPSERDRGRLRRLAAACENIRLGLMSAGRVERTEPHYAHEYSAGVPLLPVLERTVELYPVAFRETQEPTAAEESATSEAPAKMQFVVNDALTNPDYIRFAIKGTLAAMVCYIIYSAVAWPGISTAVLTCFLTGLSTIGASKQKQFNRVMGSLVGGALGIAALLIVLASFVKSRCGRGSRACRGPSRRSPENAGTASRRRA